MKWKLIFIQLFFCLLSTHVFAQTNQYKQQQTNHVRVRVLALPDSAAVPFANVVVPRTQNGTMTDTEGYFMLNVMPSDKIIVSALGFMTDTISVQRYFILNQRYFTIYLNRKNYLIREVVVEEKGMDLGIGKKNNIPQQIRSESFNDKPSIVGAVFSPLSTARYFLSKDEKQRKRARDIYANDQTWSNFYDRVTPDRIKRQTGCTDEQFERFMPYFNVHNKLSPRASEFDIESSISHLWSAWIEEEKKKQ